MRTQQINYYTSHGHAIECCACIRKQNMLIKTSIIHFSQNVGFVIECQHINF
jgi:hypothetical protein